VTKKKKTYHITHKVLWSWFTTR